ncbi:MAG: MaoC/PaaZ C-terminal domain-containing protein [Myxococcales bacterium]|nr:MaoC/PaaZ C-terminal domain-containing protein [Myxococcales bacterium]MDH5305912.1 MaoC/PaaZ C-terminal domain-containing protein [Myxococcales bacterium]MDH5566887.1 MaoC/PaaZ C-terminal domain-containing protein [Myxococcales bacterium]
MPIDLDKALGASLPGVAGAYGPDQIILYHLGVGAGVPPTDPGELAYTYEKNLKVLPSFAVVPALGSLAGLAGAPGLTFNWALLLHGEQEVILHRPLPTAAEVETQVHIPEIYDKGKAALVVLEAATRDAAGVPLFTNRFSLFLRGEGGFGGESGPKAGNKPPARAPDGIVASQSLPQQALLYRLSGDKNPLHVDPDFAKLAGFDKPILHGLCSYGIACKAIVDHVLDGDVTRVARYRARFAGVAFPGETFRTAYWKEADRILLEVKSAERDAPIISNAVIELRD